MSTLCLRFQAKIREQRLKRKRPLLPTVQSMTDIDNSMDGVAMPKSNGLLSFNGDLPSEPFQTKAPILTQHLTQSSQSVSSSSAPFQLVVMWQCLFFCLFLVLPLPRDLFLSFSALDKVFPVLIEGVSIFIASIAAREENLSSFLTFYISERSPFVEVFLLQQKCLNYLVYIKRKVKHCFDLSRQLIYNWCHES